MNGGVLTSSDYLKQRDIEKGAVAKAAPIPANIEVEFKYFFPPSPKGKSSTTIHFMGTPLKVELVDGYFSPPKKWSRAKKDIFHVFIQTLGFVDKSKAQVKKDAKKKSKEKLKTYEYIVGHPDNTDAIKINGNVSVIIDTKEMKFECVEGVIKTKDKKIFDGFLKKGWYQVSIEEDLMLEQAAQH